MAQGIQPVKGTHDILPEEQGHHAVRLDGPEIRETGDGGQADLNDKRFDNHCPKHPWHFPH